MRSGHNIRTSPCKRPQCCL